MFYDTGIFGDSIRDLNFELLSPHIYRGEREIPFDQKAFGKKRVLIGIIGAVSLKFLSISSHLEDFRLILFPPRRISYL